MEEYRPIESVVETTSEVVSESAVLQSCALGGEEVSTGAEVEIGDAPFEEAEIGND